MKQNNMNPGNYYGGDRNHQGEGILQERNKQENAEEEAERRQGKSGEHNFIPGTAPSESERKNE